MLKRVLAITTLAVVGVVGGVAVSHAAPVSRPVDPALDKKFREDVERVSADAANSYDRANTARDADHLEDAAAAYRKAIELAPKVDHPHRRLCGVLYVLGKLDEGIAECETALSLSKSSPYNMVTLARGLSERNHGDDRERAAGLARAAAEALPNDLEMQEARCAVALQGQNPLGMRRCVDRVLALDADNMLGNLVGALVSGEDGDFDEAHVRLAKAKRVGLDPRAFDEVTKILERAEKDRSWSPSFFVKTFLWTGLIIIAVWLTVMLMLLIAGTVLSRKTLATVEAAATTKAADGAGSAREQRLRRIYRGVLLISGVYFYLSMPILFGVLIVGGCGIFIAFWALGMIPLQLIAVIGLVMFGTMGAILRSLFVRAKFTPPGPPADLAKHTKLKVLVDEVAGVVGTRPVDVAYLTPGTDMAVTERGGLWGSLRGKRTERILIMGIGLFEGMTQGQLRSILAHEYGHFRNADTAGGGFALAVRRSLYTLIVRLANAGVAGSLNPVWWFLRAFHRMYLGISQGASRLQEVLADRWAIQAYGSAGFVAAYKHTVARSVEFGHEVNAKVKEVIDNEWGLPNLYTYKLEGQLATASIATEIEKEMRREPDVYDSHPASVQRIRWAEQLAVTGTSRGDDDAPVWGLFEDREDIERFMTSTVRERVQANRGVEIPATDDGDFEDDEGAGAESAEPANESAKADDAPTTSM